MVTLLRKRSVVTGIAVAVRYLNQRPFARKMSNLLTPTLTLHSTLYIMNNRQNVSQIFEKAKFL